MDPVQLCRKFRYQIDFLALDLYPLPVRLPLTVPEEFFQNCFIFLIHPRRRFQSDPCLGRILRLFQQGQKMSLSFHLMRPDPHTAAQFLSSITPRRVTLRESFISFDGNQFHLRTLLQDPGDTSLVFYRSKGTGGIQQFSTRAQHPHSIFQNIFLQFRKVLRAFFLPGFDHRRIFAEHSLPGARCIDQHFIKKSFKPLCQVLWYFVGHKGVGYAKYFQIL